MGRLTVDLSGQSVELPDELKAQEPTHVSRYWIISQILRSVGGPKAKILDIGGKEGLLRDFGFKPTVLDIEPSKEPDFVLGNALDMPFDDQSFDVSVSCDVLEHIEPADREKFISEMVRVSRVAIICAPFDHPGVAEVETEINNYYKSLLKSGHRWLQEHIDKGLPSEEATALTIRKLGHNFQNTRHFSLDIWPKVLKAHLLHAAYGDRKDIAAMARSIYQEYYKQLCAYDFSQAGYRTFFIISKDEIQLKLPVAQKINIRKRAFTDFMEDTLLTTVQKQVLSLRKSAEKQDGLLKSLKETEAKLAKTSDRLEAIMNSRSWKLARKIAKARHLGK